MTDTRLNEQELTTRLAGSHWHLGHQDDTEVIIREFELDDFAAAVSALNRVAAAAEEQNHHPDILIHGWNRLRLTLSTHSAGGLTAADFELATRIDAIL